MRDCRLFERIHHLLERCARRGHGIGSALSIRVNQEADYLSFLFDQLGMQLPAK